MAKGDNRSPYGFTGPNQFQLPTQARGLGPIQNPNANSNMPIGPSEELLKRLAMMRMANNGNQNPNAQ